ncbi:hypothetical protein [Desulfuromonas sp. AOP6]|uniref:AbiJ-NTD4 domain-containing protein n=1 Tax=Desulfuromonas sp. AOP6 TaxID=1566351 RepID=UPI00126FC7EF|nr:hypothetical protein [Desulfuromonas sp. AOP6]BCA79290.1 hypothetical protein AOP6_1077 [Desulfuromonas sp. AOP6]
MRFSQRQGITPKNKLVQKEAIDDDLRNGLWSLIKIYYWDRYDRDRHSMYGRCDYVDGSNMEHLFFSFYFHYFKMPTDTIHKYFYDALDSLRKYYFAAQWYEIFDLIEFIAEYGFEDSKESFQKACNTVLERENSAYRFVNGVITEITSDQEIQAVEEAIDNAKSFKGVKKHLETALGLLANKQNPDYRNSIKESISAVESLVKNISTDDKATLGNALKQLQDSRGLHPALKNAFSSLYGYTSDAQGIRHALMEESTLTKADARFMLVSCSAFINYIIDLLSSN